MYIAQESNQMSKSVQYKNFHFVHCTDVKKLVWYLAGVKSFCLGENSPKDRLLQKMCVYMHMQRKRASTSPE